MCTVLIGLVSLSVNAVTPMVASGGAHLLALRSDGRVLAWGNDGGGALGLGRPLTVSTPQQSVGLTDVHAIAAGEGHTLALANNGLVWAWGDNSKGQLGNDSSGRQTLPIRVRNLTTVTAIAAGCSFSIALRQDGTVWAWGDNSSGQLGDGEYTSRGTPLEVIGLSGVVAIGAGCAHAVAVKQDGTVWTWGSNAFGALGYTGYQNPRATQVPNMTGIKMIAAGSYYTVVLKQDGTVWAWGFNGNGQLGTGTDGIEPKQVPGLSGVSIISAGWFHTVALQQDGSLWAWGDNSLLGINGDGIPRKIYAVFGIKAIATGRDSSIALQQDGTVLSLQQNSPVSVEGLANVTSITAGTHHKVALKSDGTVWAWGDNYDGQLGDGAITERSTPAIIESLERVVAVAAGADHSAALMQDGTVWAWGNNSSGQLGTDTSGDRNNKSTPARVQGISLVRAIGARGDRIVALRADGTVWAWGSIPIGAHNWRSQTSPVQVNGVTGVTAIAVGDRFTVALKQDQTVWAWGDNTSGQLGNGTIKILTDLYQGDYWYQGPEYTTPGQVFGLTGVIAIAVGSRHTIALRQDGTVWAWGDNSSGQLGDGTYSSRGAPLQVIGLSGISAIGAGDSYSIAVRQDGTVWAWGGNSSGQLGDGRSSIRLTPAAVPGLSGVAAVLGAGYDTRYSGLKQQFSTVALKQDGTVWTWGSNSYGQLGDGTFADKVAPVLVLNEAVNGALDLIPDVPNGIPPSAIPRIIMEARKRGGIASLTIGANVYFGTIDLGALATGTFSGTSSYKVYVAGITPDGGIYLLDTNRNWSHYTGGPLSEYASNVTLDDTQHYYVSILDGMDLSDLIGTTVLVGYGTDDQEMLAAQRYREIYVVQPETTQ